jgi:hypothetical protein
MADVHARLAAKRFLRGIGQREFAQEAAVILGDVNLAPPDSN